jgi:ribose 5-phosphate isomerase RpiB
MRKIRNAYGVLITSTPQGMRMLNNIHDGVVLYRVSQEECAILRESVPYVKPYRKNPKNTYIQS